MASLSNGSDYPLDITPINQGLLGAFPLLGQFPEGFHESRARLEKTLQKAKAGTDNAFLLRALLNLGVLLMLQGELVPAVDFLLRAAESAKSIQSTRVLALSYALHCRAMQYTWSPAGSSLLSDEISRVFDYSTHAVSMQEEINHARSCSGYDARRETVQMSIIAQRDLVHARPMVPTSDHLALTTQVALPNLEATIAKMARSSRDDFLIGMQIELAWIHRVTRNHSTFMSTLCTARSQVQDQSALAAHIEMRLGDDHCTSFGTPETWDTVLEQGTESNAQPRDEETLHFMGSGTRDTTLARNHYDNAQNIFQNLGLLRGVAAIQLRLGYIATLDHSSSRNSKSLYKTALEHAIFAEDLYSCSGDSVGRQVARAHICLCRVGIGEEPEDLECARSIGVWGCETGSYSFAFGLGLFFAKYARRWLVALGDCEKAVAAHRLAEALFEGLHAELSRLYSITDQTEVYRFLGERDRFMVTAEHALHLCTEYSTASETSTASRIFLHGAQILSRMYTWAVKYADPDEICSITSRMTAMKDDFKKRYGERTASSIRDIVKEYPALSGSTLQSLLTEHDKQSGSGSHVPDIGMLVKKMEAFNLDPLDFRIKGTLATLDHMISTAAFLVPFYQAQKAAREGDRKSAEIAWKQAEASLETHDNEQKDIWLTLLYTDAKMHDRALSHIEAYLEKREKDYHDQQMGRTQEDRAMTDRTYWQAKLEVLAMLARTRHFAKAGDLLEEIQHRWGEDWWKIYEERVWENLSLAGQINAGLKEHNVACRYYEQAMQAFEERRDRLSIDDYKISLAGDSKVQEIYFGAACSALMLHSRSLASKDADAPSLGPHLQRAFVNLERGKARSLLDLVGGSVVSDRSSPRQSQDQWSRYKQQTALLTTRRALLANAYSTKNTSNLPYLEHLRRDVAAQEQELLSITKGLSDCGIPRAAPMISSKDIDLPHTCSSLVEGTAILQYSYQRYDLIAWLITNRGMTEVYHMEVEDVELEKYVHEFHRACEAAATDADRLASWLGNRLLPFESLQQYRRLIIVAYRALHLVPFHALPWNQGHLSDNHAVSYLPSATLLRYLGCWEKLEPSFSVLAIGNPSNMVYRDPIGGGEETMPSLPGSALEAEAIAKVVRGSRALVGATATDEAVYSYIGHHTVLHFGAHGSLCAAIPMLSTVHLAGGTQITVDQLMGRQLKAELVVLSACNTGRGRVTEGEDVIGFARTLLAAGVNHIIVSLWPVDDMAACYLMVQMYKNVMEGMSLAGALSSAQADLRGTQNEDIDACVEQLLANDSHPRIQVGRSVVRDFARNEQSTARSFSHRKFWAPFILIGA